MTGLGAFIMMPLLGNLSDRLGRKTLLTIPMILTILPLGSCCSMTTLLDLDLLFWLNRFKRLG